MRDGARVVRPVAKAAKRGWGEDSIQSSAKRRPAESDASDASDNESETNMPARHSSSVHSARRVQMEHSDDDEDDDEVDDEEEEDDEDEDEEEEGSDEYDDESESDDNDSSFSASSSNAGGESDTDRPFPAPQASKKAPSTARPQFDSSVPLFQLMQQAKASSSASPSSQFHEQLTNRANRKRPKKMEDRQQSSPEEKQKRSKHAPTEMRSDKPVRRLRVDADNSVRNFVDPRFADFTGQLDQRHFAKNYAFLDDFRQGELNTLRSVLKKTKHPERVQELKAEIAKLKQQLKERQHAVRVMNKIDAITQQEKEKVRAGIKKPFFLKNSAKREIALDDKFRELKKDGKLKKYMERKQKKQDSKGRKFMPLARRDT